MLLKELSNEEKPREKLINNGSTSLTNKELLAVIIGKGCKDADIFEVVTQIMNLIEDLNDLRNITYTELISIKGIGQAKALQLIASIELGIRIANYKKERIKLNNKKDIHDFFYPIVKYEKQEILYALYYDIKGNLLSYKEISRGTINSTLIDPNIIFKWCYRLNSQYFILIHNHPSGDARPSKEDLRMTSIIKHQARVLNLNLIDHIIIGDYSFSMKLDLNDYDKL